MRSSTTSRPQSRSHLHASKTQMLKILCASLNFSIVKPLLHALHVTKSVHRSELKTTNFHTRGFHTRGSCQRGRVQKKKDSLFPAAFVEFSGEGHLVQHYYPRSSYRCSFKLRRPTRSRHRYRHESPPECHSPQLPHVSSPNLRCTSCSCFSCCWILSATLCHYFPHFLTMSATDYCKLQLFVLMTAKIFLLTSVLSIRLSSCSLRSSICECP